MGSRCAAPAVHLQPLLYMCSLCCTSAAPAVHVQPQPSIASHSQPCTATARQQPNLTKTVEKGRFFTFQLRHMFLEPYWEHAWKLAGHMLLEPCGTHAWSLAAHMSGAWLDTCFQNFQFQAKPSHAASSKPPETWPLARFLGAKNLNLFFPAGWEPCLIGWGLACSPNASLVILFSSFILKSNQKKRKSLEHQR